jgi:preprotein translocase subunit YajC
VPELVSLLPIVAIAVLFWFLLIRPASRRQKELARMQSALVVGERVMLSSGVYGVLAEIRDDVVLLRVADGVVIEVARGAVANVVPAPGDRDTDRDTDRDADGDDGARETPGAS